MIDLAPGLRLDPDYVGAGTFGLLGKKGAGKSHTGRVLIEELWKAKITTVLVDPMGANWGLRASADGKGPGIPIPIFGGQRGDLPLERTGGALMADLVVKEGLSMVLDLEGLGSRAAEKHFVHDFLDRLYSRNKHLVHVIVDEADLFAPQKPQKGDLAVLGVTDNVVRRGRNRGIGMTLMTQRPAVLSKDVLTQIDGLIALRLVGLPDRNAVDEWLKDQGDDAAKAAGIRASLPRLKNGECWCWIPELDVLERVQVRRSQTFDSSPSLKRSDKRREPKTLADVDLAALGERMQATIERRRESDPKALRARIRDLERDLAARPAVEQERVEVEPERVEVPVLDDKEIAELARVSSALSDAGRAVAATVAEAVAPVTDAADRIAAALERVQKPDGRPPVAAAPPDAARSRAARFPAPPAAPAARRDGDARVSGSQQRILDALAALELIGMSAAAKTQVALFARVSPKSSGFEKNLSTLRTAGLLDYPAPGLVTLTAAGRALANTDAPPRTQDDLHDYVRSLVGEARWRVLRVLIDSYPDPLPKADVAEAAGVSAGSSGFEKNLSTLRSLKLIDYPQPSWVVALEVLFP